jgi:hypothetical protein
MARKLLNGLARLNDLTANAREAARRSSASSVSPARDLRRSDDELQPIAAYVVDNARQTPPAAVLSIRVEVHSQAVGAATAAADSEAQSSRFSASLAQATAHYHSLQSDHGAQPSAADRWLQAGSERAAAAYALQRSQSEPAAVTSATRLVDVRV